MSIGWVFAAIFQNSIFDSIETYLEDAFLESFIFTELCLGFTLLTYSSIAQCHIFEPEFIVIGIVVAVLSSPRPENGSEKGPKTE